MLFLSISCYAENKTLSCLSKPEMQAARSHELKELAELDQKDRENFENMSEEEQIDLMNKDLVRRKRVGEIFGEGCFKTPDDFMSAALIYQHGDTTDHYYQAFIWSMRAVQLGDKTQTSFVALAIDRYLLSTGKKQLFGSQAFASTATSWCFCMRPVEDSFPDKFRKDYSGVSLQERLEWIASLNHGKGCSESECSQVSSYEPSPQGTVPGFW